MGTATEAVALGHHGLSPAQREAVLDELKRVLTSPSFRNSARSKEFLSYVVGQRLDHDEDQLKERTIGTQLFHRRPDYDTGEDPVVRVHAGDVRRRLERYYHSVSGPSVVRIDLPVGSYLPEFVWNSGESSVAPAETPRRKLGPLLVFICGLGLLVVLAIAIAFRAALPASPGSALEEFWAPVVTTSQPVLICVAKPILYRPSPQLYREYSNSHPGAFQTEVDKWNHPLELNANEKISWGDIVIPTDYGVAMGDVYAATELSALFARLNKPSQVRIGNNYSFEDLRNSPAVAVGAFNNHWTLQMTSNLRYGFVEHDGAFTIEEQGHSGTGLAWVRSSTGEIIKDYALVTRLLDSKTGQVFIVAAGIGGNGTQAAGEFISGRDYLERAFKDAPRDWSKKNLQVVLETTITNSVAGPPRLVSSYFW